MDQIRLRDNAITWVSIILVVIGAINWGLVGLFDWNLVAALFGAGVLARIIYVLVGAAGLYLAYAAIASRPRSTLTGRPPPV
jgi:uncharacterized membrane protein YuzA (DUF378 family)